MDYRIRLSPLLLPVFAVVGAVGGGAAASVSTEELRIHFGRLFDRTFSLRDLSQINEASWPLLGGLGVRSNYKGILAVVGSTEGVVRLAFSRPQKIALFYGAKCTELFLSLEEPARFVEEIRSEARG
jgi:hypothetical protein